MKKEKKGKAPAKAKRVKLAPPRRLSVSALTVDPSIQMRAGGINAAQVQEYREALRRGARFPAAVAFDDGVQKYLADGFHRAEAHAAEDKPLLVELRAGNREAAWLHACGANDDHGLRRTAEDKHRIFGALLERYPKASSRWIAGVMKLSPTTVGEWRKKSEEAALAAAGLSSLDSEPSKRVGKDGVERSLPQRTKKEALQEQEQEPAQPGAIVAPQAWLPAAEPVAQNVPAAGGPGPQQLFDAPAVADEAAANEDEEAAAPGVPTYQGLFAGSELTGIPLRTRTAPAEPAVETAPAAVESGPPVAGRPVEETAAEVLRLDQGATPGPWRVGDSDDCPDGDADMVYGVGGSRGSDAFCGPFAREEDARLIATYRTAAPELAREVQRLQAELAWWREQASARAAQTLNFSLAVNKAGLVQCEEDGCGEFVARPKKGAALCWRHRASRENELTVVREPEAAEPEDRDVELADRDVPPQARVCEGPGCSKALDEQSKARYCSHTCRGRASKSKAKAGA